MRGFYLESPYNLSMTETDYNIYTVNLASKYIREPVKTELTLTLNLGNYTKSQNIQTFSRLP
jgi:hypothetical protein